MKKSRDLLIIAGVYILAFIVGYIACISIEGLMLRMFIFDVVATVVTFIFSLVFKNSSVYDAYWSLTPMAMSIYMFVVSGATGLWQMLFLIAFNIWSLRLTINWCIVFTDFSYEDWRYRKFRSEYSGILWFLINFGGIHMVPTLVVFAGMLPLFEIVKNPLGVLSIFGILVILLGVAFEFFADRQMHSFLAGSKSKSVCEVGLWNFSRHPNYLGEITVWLGVFLTMLPYALDKWYYGVGFLSVVMLFNVVSIPMMEKRQLSRREEYRDYKKTTSRLLILPKKG